MRLRRIFLLLLALLSLLNFSTTQSLATTSEYQIIPPENKIGLNYEKNFFYEIGDLRIIANESFDENTRVVVTVNYNGKFEDTKNSLQVSSQVVAYNLAFGTSDSYKILNDGDKIEFPSASIDSGVGVKLGVVVVGDVSDGYYEGEIKFSSVALPAVKTQYNFGKYDSKSIAWRILNVDDENMRALLVTEKCVVRKKYAATSNSAWSSSIVRKWLNGSDKDEGNYEFFKGFSSDEKEKILSVKIEDGDNSDSAAIITEDATGTDKIFLLSQTDAKVYFDDKNDRKSALGNNFVVWWLRSPASNTDVDVVLSDGGFPDIGYLANVSNSSPAVRPALWLDLSDTEKKISAMSIGFSKNTVSNDVWTPKEIKTDELKNLDDAALKKKFENSSSVILFGDLSDSGSEEISDLIRKIENCTELKTLNLSNVTGLKNFSLPDESKIEELIIEDNKALENLDVSESFLRKLYLKGCSKLEALNCESCDIIELDVRNCDKLLYLNCAHNNLVRFDATSLKNLAELKCDHQLINNVGRAEKFSFFEFLYRLNSGIFSTSSLYSSEFERVQDIKAFNESGDIVEFNLDKGDGYVYFNEEPAVIEYEYETRFNGIMMDVRVKTVASERLNEDSQGDAGGGGCNLVRSEKLGIRNVWGVLLILGMAMKSKIKRNFLLKSKSFRLKSILSCEFRSSLKFSNQNHRASPSYLYEPGKIS